MKNTKKRFLTCGMPVVAALMALVCFGGASVAQTSSDTVSAIGEAVPAEPAPAASDAVVEESPAPDLTPMPAGEFPPQPASVSVVDDVPATTDIPATDVPAVPPEGALADVAAPASPSTTTVPVSAPAEIDPRSQTETGVATGANVMGDTGVKETHSGLYYDSNSLVPNRELSAAGVTGPRKVDPAIEPGSRFVIVDKTASATSFEGQYVAAGRALKLGRYAAAMEMYEKLYRKSPRDARILMGYAVAQQGAGFSESAAQTYQELLEVQPNDADAIINLMGLMKDQYPSVTLQRLMELREKYPTNPGVPAQIGLVNAQLKNYDDAIRYLEIAATMEPQNPSHIYNMAIITDRMGQPKKAVQLYERALQLDASYGDSARSLPREEIYDRLVVLRRKA